MVQKFRGMSIYMKNVYSFLKYLQKTPPSSCRLTKAQITGVICAVQSGLSGLSKPVVLRQIAVKNKKVSHVIACDSLNQCRALASARIPQILADMTGDDSQELRYRFYGYLCAYIASLYGHRTGVFSHLMVSEVEEARGKIEPDSPVVVVNVKQHKTNQAFGMAQIYLTRQEFSWMEQWLDKRALLSPESGHFFVTGCQSPDRVLLRYLRVTWSEMRLPGKPTFTDIRTAVATHMKNTHILEIRSRLAYFMCHDTSTADRFYAMQANAAQARETRAYFEQSTCNSE
ncbi:uncharacterized protein LOC119616659 [Kryptolebias marmoratus]|uniref:uncharacterized protein LOC119616659 n=1 Tax=Kryptolebias marmoratus TaxID=37003 RepID=UPI0018ACDBC2|nr:uncharacterized protein LOC119616659 [Kryptolebias marmoratus]